MPPFPLEEEEEEEEWPTVVSLSDELESQCVTAGRGAVGRLVLGSVDGAVCRACRGVGADGGVPFVTSVAVRVSTNVVDPAPVGVDGDLAVDGRAAARSGTLLPGHLGVRLCLLCAYGLS